MDNVNRDFLSFYYFTSLRFTTIYWHNLGKLCFKSAFYPRKSPDPAFTAYQVLRIFDYDDFLPETIVLKIFDFELSVNYVYGF